MSQLEDRARLSAAIAAERAADLTFGMLAAAQYLPGAGGDDAQRADVAGREWVEASLDTFRAAEALAAGECARLGIPEWGA